MAFKTVRQPGDFENLPAIFFDRGEFHPAEQIIAAAFEP